MGFWPLLRPNLRPMQPMVTTVARRTMATDTAMAMAAMAIAWESVRLKTMKRHQLDHLLMLRPTRISMAPTPTPMLDTHMPMLDTHTRTVDTTTWASVMPTPSPRLMPRPTHGTRTPDTHTLMVDTTHMLTLDTHTHMLATTTWASVMLSRNTDSTAAATVVDTMAVDMVALDTTAADKQWFD